MMDRMVEDRLEKIVSALAAAFTPDALAVRQALASIVNFHPSSTPLQFTDPNCHPMYMPKEAKRADVRAEMRIDAAAPFVSEAYLYTLLGKEDARTLLGRFRRLCQALGIDENSLYESEKDQSS